MHEFSLAKEIADICLKATSNSEKSRIIGITLEMGQLSGVEEVALMFAFKAVSEKSILEGADISIVKVKGKAVCEECGKEYFLSDFYELCPRCNSYQKKIISGKEFRVLSIEVV